MSAPNPALSGAAKDGCASCPSYIPAFESVSYFRDGVGAPLCARYGYVLGRPGASVEANEAIARQRAATCDSYGLQRPTVPVRSKLTVALPDLEARTTAPDPQRASACTSCAMCANFVRPEAVREEMGWSAALCAAKGQLLLSHRYKYEARNCEYRQLGYVRNSTVGIDLLPEYQTGFVPSLDPIKEFFTAKENIVDPTEWPTEREVTEEEKNSGIRAWRKIADPDSGKEVFLPIYETSHFTLEDQALIPKTGSDEHPELYIDHFGGVYLAAVCWTELDETPALWGEAGTGKSELFRHLAWLMNLPFRRISITASSELDDLAGKFHYSPEKGTYFQYGRLPKAWKSPGVILIDEPNTGPPDVWQFLRPLTDNSKQLVLDMNEGEAIQRHVDSYMGMAMNPAWDVKNVGAVQIGDADANRLFHVYLDLPPAAIEREIISARVKLDGWEITKEQLDMLLNVATDLRRLSADGTIPVSWAIRPQIKVARALRWFEPITAYRRAVGDYLEPEAQQILLDQVRAHLRAGN